MTNKRFSFFDEGGIAANNTSTGIHSAINQPLDTANLNSVNNELRYRCNQLNVTRVEDKVMSHASTKKEYLLKKYPAGTGEVSIKLTDYFYEMQPAEFIIALDALKDLEYIKESVHIKLNSKNEISEILNQEEIINNWEIFKKKLVTTQFYKDIASKSAKGASDLINAGNIEFKNQENLKLTYDKVMFYHILFNNFKKVTDAPAQTLKFLSQIFVKTPVEIELTHNKVSEDDSSVVIHTSGNLLRDGLNEGDMESQYDLYYKPFVKYGYTQYFYAYDINRKINKQTGDIMEAKALLTEGVKNNYETTTECSLKQVRL